ncbi:arginine deiminase type-3, partial [Fusarium albosuccineum]
MEGSLDFDPGAFTAFGSGRWHEEWRRCMRINVLMADAGKLLRKQATFDFISSITVILVFFSTQLFFFFLGSQLKYLKLLVMRFDLLQLAFAIPPLVQALRADIRADTNRDGLVDLTGDSDVAEKGIWTEERGALFLANIADTDRRCSIQALSGPALEDDFFDRCNDASDDILRQEKYLAPLRTVPIPDVPSTAVGTITVEDQSVAKFVRIFSNKNGTWSIVTNSTTFSSAQLRNGLKLGIDSREPRRPSRWDGRAVVKFSVHEGSSHSEDKVMLRVAPVLTHHHLQAVEQVMTTNGNATDSPFQAQFVANLSALLPDLGVKTPLWLFNHS